jgi:hypothetical protein
MDCTPQSSAAFSDERSAGAAIFFVHNRWKEVRTVESMRSPRPEPESSYENVPSGWLAFAGILLITVGFFNVIHGLTALFRSDIYAFTGVGLLVFDFTTWGWILLLIGAIQFVAGAGAMTGATWARALGITFAILNAIVQLAFMPAFPLWSLTVIGLDILVIYGLTTPMRRVPLS